MARPSLPHLAALAFVVLTAAAACDGIPSGIGGRTQVRVACPLNYDTSWPTQQGRLYVDNYAQCPIRVYGPRLLTYAATAKLKVGTFGRTIRLDFVNHAGQPRQWYLESPYRYASGAGSDTLDLYQFNNSYSAASAMVGGAPGADTVYHEVTGPYARQLRATLAIKYEYGPPLSIAGPAVVLPSESWTLSSTIHDPALIAPLTYAWTRNGVWAGDSPTVSYGSSSSGEQNSFQVTITDAQGRTATGTHYVQTKTCDFAGCNDQ